MDWCVVKTGFGMFDALHAYGLGTLLASATEQAVRLKDEALVYMLSCPIQEVPPTAPDILDRMLALPGVDDLLLNERAHLRHAVPVTVLDGLLAALFTTPGSRTVSISDLLSKQRLKPSAVGDGLTKVTTAIQRWRTSLEEENLLVSGWVADALRDYDRIHPTSPIPSNANKKKDITIPMTIDAAFGYSTRRPTSDGLMTKKTNLTILGARYAALLAFIGASRFLRAQRIVGKLVNFYVPLADTLLIEQDTALPILFPVEWQPERSIIWQWFALSHDVQQPEATWKGLAYQTMQTQGAQQSISLDTGYLDGSWLAGVERDVGQGVITFWRSQIDGKNESNSDEKEGLLEFLIGRRMELWIAHLRDVARLALTSSGKAVRLYSLNEVRKITAMIHTNTHHPLREVLERKEGTLRFGHALRLLGQYNPAILRDVVELLEPVSTQDQLIRMLYRVVQECVLASAKSQFIIVPAENDFISLLDDVHHHGVHLLVGLLMILSTLRYPRTDEVDKYEVHTLISVLLSLSTPGNIVSEPELDRLTLSTDAITNTFVPESIEGVHENND